MQTRATARLGRREPSSPPPPPLPQPVVPSVATPRTKRERTVSAESPQLAKKLKQLETFGQTPFPTFPRPSEAECRRVVELLAQQHGMPQRPTHVKVEADVDELPGANCGEVPSVLDALVRTILSQNTTNKNSSRAKLGLDQAFGRHNWHAIAEAPTAKVAEAIAHGGLANIKAQRIQEVLHQVYKRYGKYSLDHMHDPGVTDQMALQELVAFNGIGPKTASCVLLFCLARDSFAVDTHVFRLSRALGWIPPRANREQAHAHLDTRVPDDIKYALHILLIRHARSCQRCAASTRHALADAKLCPLRELASGKMEDADVDFAEAKTSMKASPEPKYPVSFEDTEVDKIVVHGEYPPAVKEEAD